ncbi:MAG: T9SS type A sorting domain-containing protein [candidate division Zixibacteria bacterium]|nr:T9SS type A sorting domain-containing protein [Candidatus Tariuqbacter arcticus]
MRLLKRNKYLFIDSIQSPVWILWILTIVFLGIALFALFPSTIIAVERKPIPLYPRINTVIPPAVQTPDTVKVIAIRVEFQPDQLETTTGDGTFGSGIPETDIDPLPHNRKYFQDQLLFLKNFYEEISNGAVYLDIADAVYPLADDSAYQLPSPMWHYNHNDDDYLDYGLAMLFRDAWQAADTQNSDINFSGFDPEIDCFIIFHAGVGKDFAFDFDPTPFDIPSAYIGLEDLETEIPEDIIPDEGIPVDDTTAFVRRGMILPECENQEGYELGMHGHMALLFGNHIGVHSLYNTETGGSVIGWFGLMDQGSGKLDGLIPAPPSAWTKIYMGWAEPITITSIPQAVQAPVGAIYKIPITENEYFLVENIDSWVSPGVSWDSLRYAYYVENDDYPITFDLLRDSVSQYMEVDIDSVSGVLTNIDNWGIGRPASGLLIWHIDENVIIPGLNNNSINNDPDRLGVFIEEADGAHDIGQNYGFFSPGLGTELGSPYDAFFAENEAHLAANPNNSQVRFADDTFPDAKSNSGAFSHLIFSDFSEIDNTMSFTVANDLLLPGFPKYLPDYAFILSADIDGEPGDEIIAVTHDYAPLHSSIYAWKSDGTPVPSVDDSLLCDVDKYLYDMCAVSDFDGDGLDEIAFLAWDDYIPPGYAGYEILLLDYSPGDSTCEISYLPEAKISPYHFLIARGSMLYTACRDTLECWDISGDPQLIGNPILPWECGKACLLPGGEIVISTTGPGWVYCFTPQGDSLWAYQVEPELLFSTSAGDIDRDGEAEIILLHRYSPSPMGFQGENYLIVLNQNGSIADGFPLEISQSGGYFTPHYFPPALVDLDDDGFLEIIAAIENQSIFAFENSGVSADYFPCPIDDGLDESILVGKTDNGDYNLFFTDQSGLNAINQRAESLPGFPIALGEANYQFLGEPHHQFLFPLEDGSVGLAVADGNAVYAYQTDIVDILWASPYGDKANSSLVETLFEPIEPSGELMPVNSVYNWPNPNNPGENFTHIRYYLNYPAEIDIKIYDMAGDQIDHLRDAGVAQAPNETIWNLTNISTGVYFARIEAFGNEKKSVHFIKIAVIK